VDLAFGGFRREVRREIANLQRHLFLLFQILVSIRECDSPADDLPFNRTLFNKTMARSEIVAATAAYR
jgi:hypothetical protein